MARFLVTSIKKPRKDVVVHLETDGPEILIGTLSACDLTIHDPVASEKHADIRLSGNAFLLSDRDTAVGTYVNGLAITAPTALQPGDEIVIGVTKLAVAIEQGAEGFDLQLDLLGDKLFQKAATVKGQWVPGDREKMKDAEVTFSAFPTLRAVAWGAALVAVLFLGLLAIPSIRAGFVSPGPLHASHAALVNAKQMTCESCHIDGNVPDVACLACHADYLETRHPFPNPDGSPPASLANLRWDGFDCRRCHLGHLGEDGPLKPATETWQRWMNCERCHIGEIPARGAAPVPSGAPSGEELTAVVPGDLFSHATHVTKNGYDCASCHTRTDAGPEDFTAIGYETCAECHGAGGLGEVANLDLPADHGESGCLLCHSSAETGDMREADRLVRVFADALGEPLSAGEGRPSLYFSFTSHGHAEQARNRGQQCTDCHKRDFEPVERTARPFWHGLHIEVPILAGQRSSDEVAQRCATCHASVVASSGLSSELSYSTDGCAVCHDPGGEQIPEIAAHESSTERRFDFPHAEHADVEGGCFACHEFDVDDSFRAAPRTSARIQDCSACHAGHQQLSCAQCHAAEEDIYAREKPPERTRSGFDHFTEGHRSDDCASCHEDVPSAARVSEIRIPTDQRPVCIACHEQSRFHFAR